MDPLECPHLPATDLRHQADVPAWDAGATGVSPYPWTACSVRKQETRYHVTGKEGNGMSLKMEQRQGNDFQDARAQSSSQGFEVSKYPDTRLHQPPQFDKPKPLGGLEALRSAKLCGRTAFYRFIWAIAVLPTAQRRCRLVH